MSSIIALYRGDTIGRARIVAVSADPALVKYVAGELLGETETDDPVLSALEGGRGRALRLVREEAASAETVA